MTGERVVRVYHSGVVDEYRERDRLLREQHGFDVHLVVPPAWHEGGSLVRASSDQHVPLHVVNVRGREHPILFWYAARAFRHVLRKVRPAIVDLHEEPYSVCVAAALRAVRAEVPAAKVCIYSAQNILKRYPPPFRQFERAALRRSAAAYPCSVEAGTVLRSKGFAGAVHVMPLGVTLGRRSGADTSDGLRVGFLGRLEPYKGARVALRAFAKASVGTDAVFELVGDGSQRADLERSAAQLGVADRVVFTGAVPQADALARIAKFDVVVVPSLTTRSWKEQFGRVPAQAFAAGVPVIASDSGSLPEVVKGCGELAREGDIDDFADKLGALLRDPQRRRELGARGHARARDAFSWDRVAEAHAAMYRQLLEPSGGQDRGAAMRAMRGGAAP